MRTEAGWGVGGGGGSEIGEFVTLGPFIFYVRTDLVKVPQLKTKKTHSQCLLEQVQHAGTEYARQALTDEIHEIHVRQQLGSTLAASLRMHLQSYISLRLKHIPRIEGRCLTRKKPTRRRNRNYYHTAIAID